MIVKPIIKINNLNVTYFLGKANEVQALKNINLEIYPGEFIIFFGPSGCGKSTLLYSIAGLETNTSGDVLIDERNLVSLTDVELYDFHRKTIGMIFQAFYLINSLSAVNNVLLPQIFIESQARERGERAIALMERFGVKDQANKLPNELSGGQQQRIAICRALINDPNILLADEPVGNLDSVSADEVMNLLKTLNAQEKKTVILVTHNPAHLNLAHRVFYMKDGAIIETKVNEAINKMVAAQEKVELGQTISKDLELLARTYSNISSSQTGNLLIPFKAKQIVAEILLNMTSQEIAKIEKRVETLLMMSIDNHEEMARFFDLDEEEGGLGMDKRRANNLAKRIVEVVKEIKVLEEEETRLKKGYETSVSHEIMQIRHYLLESLEIEVKNLFSLAVIDRAIDDRLANKIDRPGFQKLLDSPPEEGGAGIDKRNARKMSQRLELLMLGKYK